MNIFGWKSTGRGLLRPAKTRVQQDRLSGIRSYGVPSLGDWPRNYEAQMREGYLSNAIAQRAVRLIAEGLASAPLTSTDAQALRLVQAMSAGQALMETVATHLLLHGNAYIEILSGMDGRPAELFALRPERMTIEADVRGWPVAYVYKAGDVASRLPADSVIHIRSIHPLDDHYGLGCLGAASGAVATHNAATRWNKALLDNAARPSGALVYEMGESGTLSGEQYTRLKEELAASFQGAGNAGRPMLLEGGLKWQAMALTPAEMDFAGLKEAAAREISLAFGVPPVLLGLPGDATYANYREANRALWNQSIIPLARKMLAAIGEGLAPYFAGLQLDIDLDAIPALAEDRERLWAQVGAADFLTAEEKRGRGGAWGGAVRGTGTRLSHRFQNGVNMVENNLQGLLEQASETGARRALARLGLDDASAAKDMNELRELLSAWRDAKRSARKAAIGWVVRMVLALLLIGLAVKLGLLGLVSQ